jgi:hypothetical protein
LRLWPAILLAPLAALAQKAAPKSGSQVDPARWFATRPGLLRVYEGHGAKRSTDEDDPPAGASCEVLSARAREGDADGAVTESCAMIVARKAKPATELTYALRKDGIWNVAVKPEGAAQPTAVERMVLPGALRVGSSWKEARGPVELDRSVRRAGGSCRAAGREFADCLILDVVQRSSEKVVRRYSETYAAGVGLVEDAQWQLVDVKGL